MTYETYEVMEASRDNPDAGPNKPPDKGMWVWWRTGPHPQGVWQAMDTHSAEWAEDYAANEKEHKPFQDEALGQPGDWGHRVCHACGEMSEGYPEPRHRTECDGICKREACFEHARKRKTDRPKGPTKVYELAAGTSRLGLYRTLTSAKKAAQAKLDGYWKDFEEAHDDENNMFEGLTATKLSWAPVQHYIDERNKRGPLGSPVPTAVYGENGSCFTIHEIKVNP